MFPSAGLCSVHIFWHSRAKGKEFSPWFPQPIVTSWIWPLAPELCATLSCFLIVPNTPGQAAKDRVGGFVGKASELEMQSRLPSVSSWDRQRAFWDQKDHYTQSCHLRPLFSNTRYLDPGNQIPRHKEKASRRDEQQSCLTTEVHSWPIIYLRLPLHGQDRKNGEERKTHKKQVSKYSDTATYPPNMGKIPFFSIIMKNKVYSLLDPNEVNQG